MESLKKQKKCLGTKASVKPIVQHIHFAFCSILYSIVGIAQHPVLFIIQPTVQHSYYKDISVIIFSKSRISHQYTLRFLNQQFIQDRPSVRPYVPSVRPSDFLCIINIDFSKLAIQIFRFFFELEETRFFGKNLSYCLNKKCPK